MIIRTAPLRPVKQTVFLADRQIVDRGNAMAHQPVFAKFPVFVAIGAKPGTGIVAELIGKSHGNAVVRVGPQFLD